MTYNLSTIQNGSGFNTYYSAINQMSSHHLTYWVLFSVFALLMFIATLRGYSIKLAFMAGAIVNLFLTMLFFTLGYVVQDILGIAFVLVIASVIVYMFGGD